jgi:UDP-N-acetylglucosamine 4,6-dehydratase/5-epimerase
VTSSGSAPSAVLTGTVLVTGGAGFIGRALLRRAARERWPARLVITSRDPAGLERVLARFPGVRGIIADLTRTDGVEAVRRALGEERFDTVVHAAAVKSVPDAERDVRAAIELNVTASERVARAAIEAGVGTVLGLSSDKACAPGGVYGLTKALMERTFADSARASSTRFVTARAGNVAGSGGSVVPLFRRQLTDSGRVTLTDPKMTRFWLSADECVALVVAGVALANEATGATLLARYPAMTIGEVAQATWLTHGGSGKVPVTVIGARPGEKLADELWNEAEAPRLVEWGSYVYLRPPLAGPAEVPLAEPRYSSEAPARWLGVAEMQAIIRDAENL